MNDNTSNLCRVPVSATYRIMNGEPVLIEAEYADIPAPDLLLFMLERSGIQTRTEVNSIETG